jgi:hypothetical protein
MKGERGRERMRWIFRGEGERIRNKALIFKHLMIQTYKYQLSQ